MTLADERLINVQVYEAHLARLRQNPDRNHVAIQLAQRHLEELSRRLRETEQT